MTVYVDVLLALNLFVNYFLLLACSKILRREVKRTRVLLGASVGAVYSLIIFAPDLNLFVSVALKLLVSVLITLGTFGYYGIRQFLRSCAALFGVSFIFGGLMLAIYLFAAPNGMMYQNGAVYFDISLLFIVVSTAVCYTVADILSFILRRNAPENHLYKIALNLRGNTIETVALMDTGNSLSDSFTDTPVMLLEYRLAKEILPPEWIEFFGESVTAESVLPGGGIRLIPFRSVGGSGLLPAFQPDLLQIKTVSGTVKVTNVYVAVVNAKLSSGDYGALLNPRLLSAEKGEKRYETHI